MPRKEIQGGLIERHPAKHRFVEHLVDRYFDLNLEGRDNLDTTRSLLEQERDIIFVANHGSNADAPVVERTLEREGYSDLSDRLVFLLGIRLKRNPATRFLTDAYTHIPVFPISVKKESQEEVNEASRLMREAGRAVGQVRERQDILFLFPEGTRTRTGELGKGIPEVASYLKAPNRVIIPMGIIGTYDLYPPGQILPRKGEVTLRVGEPIAASELSFTGSERKQAMVDYVMSSVAQLLPEDMRGHYADKQ